MCLGPDAPDADEITAQARRDMIDTGQPARDLTADQGQTWTTAELRRDFEVTGFAAPFVFVTRRSDGQKGSLELTCSPHVYFGWAEAGEGAQR